MATYHVLVFVYTKIDAAPIFIVSRINAKIVALIQRPENWLSIDFSVLWHQLLICLPIVWQNTGLPAKYGGWTTIISNFPPKPVRAHNTPQNGVCSAHTRFWVTNLCFWEYVFLPRVRHDIFNFFKSEQNRYQDFTDGLEGCLKVSRNCGSQKYNLGDQKVCSILSWSFFYLQLNCT